MQLLQRSGRGAGYLDREENITLDANRRSLMMIHIAQSKNDPALLETMKQVNNRGQVGGAAASAPATVEGNVSNCMVLHNMFYSALEQGPHWDIDIQLGARAASDA